VNPARGTHCALIAPAQPFQIDSDAIKSPANAWPLVCAALLASPKRLLAIALAGFAPVGMLSAPGLPPPPQSDQTQYRPEQDQSSGFRCWNLPRVVYAGRRRMRFRH
jgi:hypothetical protein